MIRTTHEGSGTDGNGTPDESLAVGTSEITCAEVVGKVGMLPKPGRPDCRSAGRPSSAESRAPWSASWWLMANIYSWRPMMAAVKA